VYQLWRQIPTEFEFNDSLLLLLLRTSNASITGMYCIVLYCIILYYIVLYCIVLYCGEYVLTNLLHIITIIITTSISADFAFDSLYERKGILYIVVICISLYIKINTNIVI
jgi:hypothetical protein